MYAKSEKNSGTQKKFELHFSSVVIDSFLSSPLGELWQVLPLASLSASIILPTPKSKAGRKGWFDESQAIAVMLLKHHEGLSDAKLLRNLSTNSDYQLFCGLTFEQGERIQDMTLLSSWRTKFGFHMNVNSFQSILQYHWKKYLSDKQVNKMDATRSGTGAWSLISLFRPV